MTQRRSVQELLSVGDPSWPTVQNWIAGAGNSVEVLPADEMAGRRALEESQVTLGSPMGAIVYYTGGLLVDRSWLRILGSGHTKLPRSMPEWNRRRSTTSEGSPLRYWLIADDVVGGFYALNGGAFGSGPGHVFYFGPDSLRWESLNGMGYSQFLIWSFSPELGIFYKSMRWAGWESEIQSLRGDQALLFYPFLWTKEGKDPRNCSRKPCPIDEVFSLNVLELPAQLESSEERR